MQVHDSNAGVQQRRNQVQTHFRSENADARIVATDSLLGGLERCVPGPLASIQGADGQTRQPFRKAFQQQKQFPDNNAHLLRRCGTKIVAAVPHLSNCTVGEIARHAKHDAIVRFGTRLCSAIQHGLLNSERHILVCARARPLHLAQFAGYAEWNKSEFNQGYALLNMRMRHYGVEQRKDVLGMLFVDKCCALVRWNQR